MESAFQRLSAGKKLGDKDTAKFLADPDVVLHDAKTGNTIMHLCAARSNVRASPSSHIESPLFMLGDGKACMRLPAPSRACTRAHAV